MRGRVRAAQGDLAGAEADLRASLEGLRRTGKDDDEARKSARERARVLRLRGNEAGAAAVDVFGAVAAPVCDAMPAGAGTMGASEPAAAATA